MSGAGPLAGLYGAIITGFFAALLGGTPSQVCLSSWQLQISTLLTLLCQLKQYELTPTAVLQITGPTDESHVCLHLHKHGASVLAAGLEVMLHGQGARVSSSAVSTGAHVQHGP